jgi:predicted membrane channel-forming protein YqfA (hemolysin III family)
MRTILKILSFIGLGLTILPSVLVLTRTIDMELNKTLMMVGTLLWFGTVVFWMNKKKKAI